MRFGLRTIFRGPLAGVAVALLLLGCAQNTLTSTVAEPAPTVGLQSRLSNFFSPENQREVLADTRVHPRIGSGAREPGGFIDARRINESPLERARRVREDFETRVSLGEGARATSVETQPPSQLSFNPNERVSLNFANEPLSNVIRQVLGGILRVNYLADPDIQGAVTFRTEQPIPAAQVLQVLQNILARNGLAIRLINGVYHVGTLEELLLLEANTEAGNLAQDTTRVVRISRGNALTLAEAISPLLPTGMTVTPYGDANAVILRGNPDEFGAVESLIQTLIDTGIAEQRVAIFQLRESSPDAVAARITELYAALGRPPVTVIPLAQRQALLVASSSRQAINDVRRLVREIDLDLRDTVSLRVLQLTHLNAQDVADQITAVFTGTAVEVDRTAAVARREGSNIIQSAVDRATTGVDARDGGPLSSVLADRVTDTRDAAQQAGAVTAETAVRIPASEVSIVPDTRNNALLIRSSYDVFRRIQEVVVALDLPVGQVVIEANVLEVDINDDLALGVQFYLQTKGLFARSSVGPGGAADPGGAGLVGIVRSSIGGLSFDVIVNALQAITNVKVLSSPYVTVVDGATARLSVGTQIPFTTASQTSSSAGVVTVTQEIETRDVGVILAVTPRIRPDNSVLLAIEQEVSSALEFTTGSDEVTNPIIAQRNITSQITVQSGGTALLGGLIVDRQEKNETGIPVLRRIPILGAAFRQTENTQARSELLVLITPRVVRTSHQLELLTRQLRSFTHGQGHFVYKN